MPSCSQRANENRISETLTAHVPPPSFGDENTTHPGNASPRKLGLCVLRQRPSRNTAAEATFRRTTAVALRCCVRSPNRTCRRLCFEIDTHSTISLPSCLSDGSRKKVNLFKTVRSDCRVIICYYFPRSFGGNTTGHLGVASPTASIPFPESGRSLPI